MTYRITFRPHRVCSRHPGKVTWTYVKPDESRRGWQRFPFAADGLSMYQWAAADRQDRSTSNRQRKVSSERRRNRYSISIHTIFSWLASVLGLNVDIFLLGASTYIGKMEEEQLSLKKLILVSARERKGISTYMTAAFSEKPENACLINTPSRCLSPIQSCTCTVPQPFYKANNTRKSKNQITRPKLEDRKVATFPIHETLYSKNGGRGGEEGEAHLSKAEKTISQENQLNIARTRNHAEKNPRTRKVPRKNKIMTVNVCVVRDCAFFVCLHAHSKEPVGSTICRLQLHSKGSLEVGTHLGRGH